MLRAKRESYHALFWLAIIWTLGSCITNALSEVVHPIAQLGVQSVIAFAILVFVDRGKSFNEVMVRVSEVSKDGLLFHLRGIVGAVIGICGIAYSYSHLSIAVVTWLKALPISIIWGVVLLGERPNRSQIISLGLGSMGAMVCGFEKDGGGDDGLFYLLICLGSCFCFSFGRVIAKPLIDKYGLVVQSQGSMFIFAFYGLILGCFGSGIKIGDLSTVVLLLVQGVLCAIASILLSKGLKSLETAESELMFKTEAIWAPIFGLTVFGQKVGWFQILGGFLIVLSVLPPLLSREGKN